MFKNLKTTLFFHAPLLLCLFLGTVFYYTKYSFHYNGFDLFQLSILPLIALYFVVRRFWRKHLNEQGLFKNHKLSIWAVFFTIILTVFVIYLAFIPAEQKFVNYHPEHPTPDRFAVNAKLSDYMKTFLDQMIVCGYLMQENETAECEVMHTVELDNNPKTFEVFILDKKIDNCKKNSCKLMLAQMTAEAMNKARSHQEENAPPSEGKLLNSWTVNNPDLLITPTLHNGWYNFELNLGDILSVFEYSTQSQRYEQR
jgi:hypothetical protein